MSKQYNIKVTFQDGNEKTSVFSAGRTLRLKAAPQSKYMLVDAQTGVAPDVIMLKRVGKDLLIDIIDDAQADLDVVIEGYFDEVQPSSLVGQAEDGLIYSYVPQAEGVQMAALSGEQTLAYVLGDATATSGAAVGVLAFNPLLAAAGAGGAAAAAGGGGGGGGGGDTSPPDTPSAPTAYLDDVGAVRSNSSSAATTDDTRPGIRVPSGLTDTPSLYVDGVRVPATYDAVTGTLTPNNPIAEGAHRITYTLTDAAGNESAQSGALQLTVDTTPPAKPAAPNGYEDNVGAVQNAASTAVVTDDARPGLNLGSIPAQTVPKLYVNGAEVAATFDPATGRLTPVNPLPDGAVQLQYSLTDAAGNESVLSDSLSVTVDASAPQKPASPTTFNDNDGPLI